MEEGYRDYGHDIDNTDTVLQAALASAVRLNKPGGYRPRRGIPPRRRAGR